MLKDLSIGELADYYELTTKLVDRYASELRSMIGKECGSAWNNTHKKFSSLSRQLDKLRSEVERRIEALDVKDEDI